MASLYLLVLAATCLAARAFPNNPLPYINTIFLDEKLEGEIFEHVDDFNDVTLYSSASTNPYRLPTTTRPHHYIILWTIDTIDRKFSGNVKIQLYATQANVNEIVIQSHELDIESVSLKKGNDEVAIRDYYFESEYHFLKVRVLNGVLEYKATENVLYTLSIDFKAPLRKDMYGIYETWFRNKATDEVSWMASTQFQPTWARAAFPCYDEPGFKATFEVTIRRPSAYKSWFCTTQKSTSNDATTGYGEDVYNVTPKMSTYLLALIVAEYDSKKDVTSGNPKYEIIARPNAISTGQGDYAFDVGQKLQQMMSTHTNYDFYSQHPNLKMTHAAIPDFGAGAMENWGLITYREAYLMHDESQTSGYFKQVIAYIMSHEIAHMWFGNLVTCNWWDVLWLNEGFARYYQYFLTDRVEGYMGLGERFINEQVHASLLFDSSNNPHPLNNYGVGSPQAVSDMFSTISYNKGACIIRMTEYLLGTNVHRDGLRNYLKEREFDMGEPIHLFEALHKAAVAQNAISEYGADFSVVEYYKTWTEQGGHPVLNVYIDHKTGAMKIYQRRFNINSGYSTATTNWIVPITFTTASDPDFSKTKPTHILREAITIIQKPLTTAGDEWVIFNNQQIGYYRVNYDDYSWDLIVKALRGPEREKIHHANKAQIVNDVLQFARSGLMGYNRALNIISFLKDEVEYTPWATAITGFNWVRNRLQGTEYREEFEKILADWTKTVMSTLGYTKRATDTFMTSYLRYQMAPFVCNLGVQECREAAVSQFAGLKQNPSVEVEPDNRNWVYCNALRQGDAADFELLWTRFVNHNVYTEKILLLQVLGCTPHRESLHKLVDNIVSDTHLIRSQDYTTAFNSAVSGNEGNTQIVFDYIKQNLQKVKAAFESVRTPLSYISARLRTVAEVDAFQKWADENREELGAAYQAVRSDAQSSRNAIAWAAMVKGDIENYIRWGDQEIQSTPPSTGGETDPPELVTPLPLVQDDPPVLTTPAPPSSASTAALSALTVSLGLVAYFAM